MLDVQLFRDAPDRVRKNLERRGMDPAVVDDVVRLDRSWRDTLNRINELRARRNKAAVAVGQAKKAGHDAPAVLVEMKDLGAELERLDAALRQYEEDRNELLMRLPNLMHETVPMGKDESGNVPLQTVGGPTRHAFQALSHVDLLVGLGLADLDRAAKTSGARFFFLTDDGVRLSFAIQEYAMDYLQERGFHLIDPPYLLRREMVAGATALADFEDVIFKVEGEDLYLIATSEHALGAMHQGEILEEKDLPLRYAGVSPCFRKEAGAHGKDTKGIFRVRQFHKVEQFIFCRPEDSEKLHAELLANAEALVAGLGLPYRVVNICSGDLGGVAAKKYDVEAWMPVQGAYRELVSCSNCTDYQARRWQIRTRPSTDAPTRFVHTLNSTALAVERTMAALLENFQRADGTVAVPVPLQRYMGGRTALAPIH